MKVFEANGFAIDVHLLHRNKNGNSVMSYYDGGTCQHLVTSDTDWLDVKTMFPDYTTPSIMVKCGDLQDCLVKFEVQFTCVDLVGAIGVSPGPSATTLSPIAIPFVPRFLCLGCSGAIGGVVNDQVVVACCLTAGRDNCASEIPVQGSGTVTYTCPSSTVAIAGVGCTAPFKVSANAAELLVPKGKTLELPGSTFAEYTMPRRPVAVLVERWERLGRLRSFRSFVRAIGDVHQVRQRPRRHHGRPESDHVLLERRAHRLCQ